MTTERPVRLEGIRWMLIGLFAGGSRPRLAATQWLLEDPVFSGRIPSPAPRRRRLVLKPA